MNAAERAESLDVACKITTVVNLFKSEFPDTWEDLYPWFNDPETKRLIDPDSIDIGFHFFGRNSLCQSISILVQIRFYQDPTEHYRRLIGVEAMGYEFQGQQWRFSTVDDWRFVGIRQPMLEAQEKLKHICCQIFQLFNSQSQKT